MRAAKERRQRPTLTRQGRLNIMAADHPARRVTRVGEDPLRMTDRRDYMARILRVLMTDAVDGLLTTMDILEDLLIIHDLMKEAGGPPFLDEKVLIASMNRAGWLGGCWELDDPMSGPTAAACADWRLDGAKILLRVCDGDRDSLKTMMETVRAINELNAYGLPCFLESLPVVKTEKGYAVVKTADELARICGAAAALGDSARYLWLKLPYCEGYEKVAGATALPILLLGGEPIGDATPFLRELEAGLKAGANVRGALVGRNVLFPGDDDPLAVAEAVGGIIYKGWSVEQALAAQAGYRGSRMDWIRRYFD
jgi:DhnA family fructose-bisphosphate aldolase class Ia